MCVPSHIYTQDLSGLLKDISNADDGKIESRLTLRVNCSTAKEEDGRSCCSRAGMQRVRDENGRKKIKKQEERA